MSVTGQEVQIYIYLWNSDLRQYSATYDYMFTLPVNPERVRIRDYMEWKVRHTGTKRYKKARNRKRFHSKMSLSGMIPYDKVQELRWIVSQNAKVKIKFLSPLNYLNPPDYTSDFNSITEDEFYGVITSLEIASTQKPYEWQYSMEVERTRPPPDA